MKTSPCTAQPLPTGDLGGPWILWAALLTIVAIRLAGLAFAATDLFFDEAQYWLWSREPAFGYYSKPPLIAWIIGLATAICGDGEACIRAPAPILHTLTAALIFHLGNRLYGRTTGIWAALLFITAPGISLSSLVISTDVPLLACWAAALIALNRYLDRRDLASALLLGLAIGIGLNAKYAMIYLPACTVLMAVMSPAHRWLLIRPSTYLALAVAGALAVPNLIWNLQNGLATFVHTGDNANWSTAAIDLADGIEFMAAQLVVFGPLLLPALAVMVIRRQTTGRPEADRLLLFHSLPILAVMIVQAFISRAHANWAATAYPAAVILVAAWALAPGRQWILKASLPLHGLVLIALPLFAHWAPQVRLPEIGRPFERALGWRQAADGLRTVVTAARAKTLVLTRRADAAAMHYYLRDSGLALYAWKPPGGPPSDHFQLTRPMPADPVPPVLLVAIHDRPGHLPLEDRLTPLAQFPVSRGVSKTLKYHVFVVNPP